VTRLKQGRDGGVAGEARELNVNHMLNFIQVAEWGNISKAAEFLNIAQPALTRPEEARREVARVVMTISGIVAMIKGGIFNPA
jgi:hypothetical protein